MSERRADFRSGRAHRFRFRAITAFLAFVVLGATANWAAEEPGGALTRPKQAFQAPARVPGERTQQWLPSPITVVGPDQESAVSFAEGLRTAGFSIAPLSVSQFNARITTTLKQEGSPSSANVATSASDHGSA